MQALGRRFKANGTRGQHAFAESSQTCCFAALLVWCRVLPRPEDPFDISRRVFQIRDRDTGVVDSPSMHPVLLSMTKSPREELFEFAYLLS